MAWGVISLNTIRWIGSSASLLRSEFCIWNAMASPSRSLSDARSTRLDFFAAFCRSLRSLALPRIVRYSGSKSPSTSIPTRDFGRSMRCPIDASTVYLEPRYFSMVLAFAGDSTMTRMPLAAAFFAPDFALPLVPAFDGAFAFALGFSFGFGSAETVADREEFAVDGIETAPSPANALSGAAP